MSDAGVSDAVAAYEIRRVTASGTEAREDQVAVEAPLEIRVNDRGYAVTMRTPGHDRELAAGFLVSEGLVTGPEELVAVDVVDEPGDVVNARVTGVGSLTAGDRHRNVYTTSSCGVCGLASIDAVATTSRFDVSDDPITFTAEAIARWPDLLRAEQSVFDLTGGVHAAALIRADGTVVTVGEDVGRHNAVDKVVGAAALAGDLPLSGHILQVSGRASFELVQKAAMAGVSVLAAVSAPSSLAVDLASSLGMTLIGFSRATSFNVYSGDHRIVSGQP